MGGLGVASRRPGPVDMMQRMGVNAAVVPTTEIQSFLIGQDEPPMNALLGTGRWGVLHLTETHIVLVRLFSDPDVPEEVQPAAADEVVPGQESSAKDGQGSKESTEE